MGEQRYAIAVFIAGLLLLGGRAGLCDTWQLTSEKGLKEVEAEGEGGYVRAVSEIKGLIADGQTKAAKKAIKEFREAYPEAAGEDFDAFVKGELYFSRGKFIRSIRAYDEFLDEYPGSMLYDAALEREYSIGLAYLGGQKKRVLGVFAIKGYAEGEKIMERIVDRAGDGPTGIKASLAVADSLEERGKFGEAYFKWSEISTRWPTGEMGEGALLGMGRCKHAAYQGPSYDVSSLKSARSYYEEYMRRYPEKAEEYEIDKKLEQITEQLAYKEYRIGLYYDKKGDMQPANLYYQMVVDNWPGSKAATMSRRRMGKDKNEKEEQK